MTPADKYSAEKIVWLQTWAPNLFSFKLSRPAGFEFVPGQFARIGVPALRSDRAQDATRDTPAASGAPAAHDTALVWRAYSIASAADDPELEFFSIVIPDGEFTPPLARLRVGDTVYVDRASYGFLTCGRFVDGTDLWLLATGTGLAPFLAILRTEQTWLDYQHLVVVHCVRYPNELAYADTIAALAARHATHARLHYVPVVTRAVHPGALRARIPALIESGELERHVGLSLAPQRARVMICGNPGMTSAVRRVLSARGLAVSRRSAPAHMAVENYW
jgi:ferredoxin--NADP+ reductase